MKIYRSENGLVELNKEDAWSPRSDVDLLEYDYTGGNPGLSREIILDPEKGPQIRKEE